MVAVGSAPPLFSREGVSAAYRRIGTVLRGFLGKHDLFACGYLNELVERRLPVTQAHEEAKWTKESHVQSSVPRMMRAAGFRNIHTTWAGDDRIVESIDEFWDVQITFSSIGRKRLATASKEAVGRLRREFDTGCTRTQAAGGRLRCPTGALIVTGTAGVSPMRTLAPRTEASAVHALRKPA